MKLIQTLQHHFRKWGGGGQKPLGTFPKIYPFWCDHPSLCLIAKSNWNFQSASKFPQKCIMILRRWAVIGKYYTWVVFWLDFPPSVSVAECLVHPWSSQVPGEGLIPGEALRIGNPSLQNAKTFFTHTPAVGNTNMSHVALIFIGGKS